jgi:hypothetical protein
MRMSHGEARRRDEWTYLDAPGTAATAIAKLEARA